MPADKTAPRTVQFYHIRAVFLHNLLQYNNWVSELLESDIRPIMTNTGPDTHEYDVLRASRGTLATSMQRPLNGLPVQGLLVN